MVLDLTRESADWHSLFFIGGKMEDLKVIESGIKELLSKLNYELYSLKFIKKNKEYTLEVIVDRDDDISMDDIVKVSEAISNYLDEVDFSDVAYTLNVSSLGIEKPLKVDKLEKYINRYIYVHLINPVEGNNSYTGTLLEVKENQIFLQIMIKTRKKIIEINKENIDKCTFAIKF